MVRRNKIIEIGWNKGKTHPLLSKFGYSDYSTTHSEMDVLTRYGGDLSNVSLWNVRVNRKGALRMSKPCIYCVPMIDYFGVKEIWYTDQDGRFIRVKSG